MTVMDNRIALYNEAIISTEAKFKELIDSNYIETSLITMLPAYAIPNTEGVKHDRIILLRDYILNCIHRRLIDKPLHPSQRMETESQSIIHSNDQRISSLEYKLDEILKHLKPSKNDSPPVGGTSTSTPRTPRNVRVQQSPKNVRVQQSPKNVRIQQSPLVQKPEDEVSITSEGMERKSKRNHPKRKLLTKR